MKKIISILALVLAMTMLMSVAAFAEDAAPAKTFALGEGAEAEMTAKNVTVTPADDSIAVTLNAAVTGADYSILLVSGDALPTAESNIAYINQDDAESASLAFSVLPKLGSCTDDMTIYIGSNAENAELISIPVTYKATAPTGCKVTLMNGTATVASELAIDAEGKVTLPADTAFNKTSPAGYTFALYSWVTADEATEYLAGATVAATDLEGKTLYAKFATTKLRGDFNENGAIDATDMNPIQFKVKGLLPTMQKNVGLAIYEGSDVLKGDFNGNGAIDATDMNPIQFKVKGLLPTMQKDVDKPYYVVNK